jgi:ABC-type multidrug transport system fused ATPase/permease subunit
VAETTHTRGTFAKVRPFLRTYRKKLIGLVTLTALLSILAMLPPLLTRATINRVIANGEHDLLPLLALFMLLIPLLHALCSYLQVLGVALVGQSFVMDVRRRVYEHLLRLGMPFFGKNNTGKLVNRLMGDSSVMQQILTVTSVQIISDLICALFAISATLIINWRLALPLILFVALFVLNYRTSIGSIRKATRGFRGAEDRVASGVQTRLTANLTVKTFGAEIRENSIFRGDSDASLELMREGRIATSRFGLNTELLKETGHVIIYFLGCWMVLREQADYGDVIAFTAYTMQLLMPAVRFSNIAQQLQNVKISADRLFEILDDKPTIVQDPHPVRLSKPTGRIELQNVHFHYVQGKPILRGVSITADPGQTIALVGPTGCGKSTILSLLMRLYDISDGTITLDGVEIRKLHLRDLRKAFGIVLQESLLFQVSIADNIRYSRQNATLAEIEHAARIAEIHNDIVKLPHGYDSVVGDRDIQLSVGQKQRISIARAVLADPTILIMDEATSALDSESEKAIQIAMERFLKGRTSFIVAHRLSTIRNADKIVLLGAGKIDEIGSHDELMALPHGKYRELYERHAGRGSLSEEES